MITHEFILCSEIPRKISYSNYSKEEMVIIDDDFILANYPTIEKVQMYCEYIGNTIEGLAYHGITILTYDMANELKTALINECAESEDLQKLITILDKAILNKCYIVHFGV